MITRPKIWLVCESCGEFFTEKQAKENQICPECKKGKLKLSCEECGEFLNACECGKKEKKAK
ncbi:MAG: hypothetical protein AABX17_01380 [Nanoarchaeota archaeon]